MRALLPPTGRCSDVADALINPTACQRYVRMLGMYRIVNFIIRPEPDSKCAIRPEPEPDSTKVASQA